MRYLIYIAMLFGAMFINNASYAGPHGGFHGGGFHGGGFHGSPYPAPRNPGYVRPNNYGRQRPYWNNGRWMWPRWHRGGFTWSIQPPFYLYRFGSWGYYWYYCPAYDRFYPDTLTCPMWLLERATEY